MLDATTMFVDAMTASTQVIERDGKKIGYIHIWSYAGDKYQQQLEEELLYGRLSEADGFVLDLREGWGGAPLTALNIYTAQNLSVRNIPRNGRQYMSNSAWKKPVVMLVNQGSRSAKEILAFGFRQYGIGPVVGTKTAGAVVAGRPFIMQDGSLLYVAVSDVYVNGNERLEGKGVTPDITVPFSLEYAQGADPQKERAIEVVLAAVKQS
jgi:carboxyl-terminal processing protease